MLHNKTCPTAVTQVHVMELIRNLECVQLDPVAAVERNQHLVLAARLAKYQPKTLEQLLETGRVFEYWANAACVIPMEDYPIFEVTRRRLRQLLQPHLDQLDSVADHILNRLAMEGPLPSKAFETDERVHGYWETSTAQPRTKATSHALNLLNDMGRILVVRREGTTRYFDIPEHAVPKKLLDDAARMSDEEARSALVEKYMRAYRVFDVADSRFGWHRMSAADRRKVVAERVADGRVIPLEIEGVKRPYFILAEDEDSLRRCAMDAMAEPNRTTGARVRFLPPLDNLLWRRERIEDLFDFSYTWEVYIPATKRKYGYYAMPILAGDAFIGRMDPRLDRKKAQLNIRLLQIEPHIRWTKILRHRVFRALEEFAQLHQATLGEIEEVRHDA
ncbi:MAG: winged helix DNA-binding domain-containing protein [Alicyclobacillus sp.]|nr:winged helix DNA-binding domain-containing protein [Alicyclobacillus sp.]